MIKNDVMVTSDEIQNDSIVNKNIKRRRGKRV